MFKGVFERIGWLIECREEVRRGVFMLICNF